VLGRARELEAQGRRIVHFEIGEPDFDTPREIVDATVQALRDEKLTHYGPNMGYLPLRKAIAQKLLEENNIIVDPESEIMVTVGAAEAIIDIILAFINPGDEVIVFTPAYMNYANVVNLAGGTPVTIPLKEEKDFQIEASELKKAITSKTRMIIINNPGNPTGTVYDKEVLMEVSRIACEYDILVLSDEIYEGITYSGASFYSLAAFEGMKERTITVNGFSKAYAMTGWRLGYLVADSRLIPPILKLHQYITTCAPTFIQAGVAKAMLSKSCKDYIKKMVDAFERRRRVLIEAIEKIPGLSCAHPKGAFYAFVNMGSTGLNCEEFASRLLEEKGVALVPGTGFGWNFRNYVRISYATSESEIREGLKRIDEFVKRI